MTDFNLTIRVPNATDPANPTTSTHQIEERDGNATTITVQEARDMVAAAGTNAETATYVVEGTEYSHAQLQALIAAAPDPAPNPNPDPAPNPNPDPAPTALPSGTTSFVLGATLDGLAGTRFGGGISLIPQLRLRSSETSRFVYNVGLPLGFHFLTAPGSSSLSSGQVLSLYGDNAAIRDVGSVNNIESGTRDTSQLFNFSLQAMFNPEYELSSTGRWLMGLYGQAGFAVLPGSHSDTVSLRSGNPYPGACPPDDIYCTEAPPPSPGSVGPLNFSQSFTDFAFTGGAGLTLRYAAGDAGAQSFFARLGYQGITGSENRPADHMAMLSLGGTFDFVGGGASVPSGVRSERPDTPEPPSAPETLPAQPIGQLAISGSFPEGTTATVSPSNETITVGADGLLVIPPSALREGTNTIVVCQPGQTGDECTTYQITINPAPETPGTNSAFTPASSVTARQGQTGVLNVGTVSVPRDGTVRYQVRYADGNWSPVITATFPADAPADQAEADVSVTIPANKIGNEGAHQAVVAILGTDRTSVRVNYSVTDTPPHATLTAGSVTSTSSYYSNDTIRIRVTSDVAGPARITVGGHTEDVTLTVGVNNISMTGRPKTWNTGGRRGRRSDQTITIQPLDGTNPVGTSLTVGTVSIRRAGGGGRRATPRPTPNF